MTSAEKSDGCLFCNHLAHDGGDAVLWRGPSAFIVLNAFPYNSGHVMVAPSRHVGELERLEDHEANALMDATRRAVTALRDALTPEGFNVGMNLGRVGGAGVPDHLHVHVVPRWAGDTNFMPVVAGTKVLPEMLADTAAKLRPHLED